MFAPYLCCSFHHCSPLVVLVINVIVVKEQINIQMGALYEVLRVLRGHQL